MADKTEIEQALAQRGLVASAADVLWNEGEPSPTLDGPSSVARILGDDGLGRTFDVLVASGDFDQRELLARAVERSHQYYGVPGSLVAGAARAWADALSDTEANDMFYSEAATLYERAQAEAVVAAAQTKEALRARVHGG